MAVAVNAQVLCNDDPTRPTTPWRLSIRTWEAVVKTTSLYASVRTHRDRLGCGGFNAGAQQGSATFGGDPMVGWGRSTVRDAVLRVKSGPASSFYQATGTDTPRNNKEATVDSTGATGTIDAGRIRRAAAFDRHASLAPAAGVCVINTASTSKEASPCGAVG